MSIDPSPLKSPIRVFTVDDHPLLREGIAALVGAESDMELVAEASNGQEAIEKAKELKPDLVILDITMPVLNGLDAARQIRTFAPDLPILILSVHKSRQVVEEAKKIGVRGYVTKGEAIQKLLLAVDTVLQNETFFPTDL